MTSYLEDVLHPDSMDMFDDRLGSIDSIIAVDRAYEEIGSEFHDLRDTHLNEIR